MASFKPTNKPEYEDKSFKTLVSQIKETHPERTAIVDFDLVTFKAASAAEKRTVLIHCDDWEEPKPFKNKTEFYGRGKKIGGWLEQHNEGRRLKGLPPYTRDDFTIEDVQEAQDVASALHTTKMMAVSILEALGTRKHQLYIGRGNSWRQERSTLMKYKGNRDNSIKPIHLRAVEEYAIEQLGAIVVDKEYQGGVYETDDWVVMVARGKPNHIVVSSDKDSLGTGVLTYNHDKPEMGIVDGDCLGELWLDSKKKVRGYGRKFLAFQCICMDKADNYAAHEHSDVRWGEVTAYNWLKDCTTDKEIWEAKVAAYKHLYPEPKEITTWKGDVITIDWLYVFKEMFAMAHMLRFEGDDIDVERVLKHMKIDY
jgi:hypothetical protein